MSSETDHPRQRTVAELLAQHGDAGATGRRRRRREADVDGEATMTANGVAAGPAAWAPPPGPDRSVLREPVPRDTVREAPPREPVRREASSPPVRPYVPEQQPPPPGNGAGAHRNGTDMFAPPAPRTGRRRAPEPVPENPTDHIPRYRDDRAGVVDPGLTGPIDQQQVAALRGPVVEKPAPPAEPSDDGDGGPATMIGVAPAGAEAWHRSRTGLRPEPDEAGGPPTQAASPLDFDDHPAGLDDDGFDDVDGGSAEGPDGEVEERPSRRRAARAVAEPSPGQAWVAVVAQWIIGAIGGAALWVGFRFLWRELPVVALAAAVLVTVGLVLVVRALLRNNDMRTTVFAVLVGLLLTVSPAILVLLGK